MSHTWLQRRQVPKKSLTKVKAMTEIEEIKKKISIKERCAKTMEEKLLKQISENAVCIARISEDNLALRKECNAKSFNDFGLFQEHFNHRPKEELLAKRRKSFQEMVEDYDESIALKKNQVNRLQHLKQEKKKELAKMKGDFKALLIPEKDFSKYKDEAVALENHLDKMRQKIHLAKQLNVIYRQVYDQLKKEVLKYPRLLTELQDKIEIVCHEREDFKNIYLIAHQENETTQKEKMVLESKVREEKRERGVIIKKMERQTRLKVEPDPRSSDLIPYKTDRCEISNNEENDSNVPL